MAFEEIFVATCVYLFAAVVSVPVAKKLGLSSVLGYLIAGILIGPFVFGVVGNEGEDVMHFAEFGVVLMLFLIGLELEPSLLWRLRGPILGLGGLQVAVTTILVMAIAMFFGLSWQMSLAIGMSLALSSTAIVLQSLQEKGLTKTSGGQSAFAVLLFQDIAVIPMLAVLPLLATITPEKKDDHGHGHGHGETNAFAEWVSHQPGWINTLLVIGAVVLIIVAGKYALRPILRAIAGTKLRETFTAFALLLVIGIALLMNWLGVSAALGTFLAGVVLANSEYRHELESDIEPFKGILLGVFFISVGASIDFSLIAERPGVVAAIVFGLIFLKAAILFVLGWFGKLPTGQRLLFCLALAQGGEFAFVLLGAAVTGGAVSGEIAQVLIASVAVTMALTPLILMAEERLIRPKFHKPEEDDREMDEMDEDAPVILAGFGRFGNYVGRLLRSQGVDVTVIDHDSDHIEFLRKIGVKAFFGDACRHDLLESAGAAEAKVLIIALEDDHKSEELVEMARRHFPNLKIFVRAVDRPHFYDLMNLEVDFTVHQHAGSAIQLGSEVLKELGWRPNRAARVARWFEHYDHESSRSLAAVHRDEKVYVLSVRQRVAELEEQFQRDARVPGGSVGAAWDNEALREALKKNKL
ncbi:MAG: monovalent cation:proton antiporter-2 (CPA2) family protein [Verrucomicrobiota bacterium]